MVSACAIMSYSILMHAIVRLVPGGHAFSVHNVHVSRSFGGAFCSIEQHAHSSCGNWQTTICEPSVAADTDMLLHACMHSTTILVAMMQCWCHAMQMSCCVHELPVQCITTTLVEHLTLVRPTK